MSFLGLGESSIGNALIRVGADTRQLRTQMAAANAQIRADAQATGTQIQRQVQGTSAVVAEQAKKMSLAAQAVKYSLIGIGVGFAAFTIDAIKTAREFDRTMGQVYALTGATGDQMVKLKAQTLELAKVLPQSPQKLAEGLYYILSSGIDAAHAMDVLKISAMDATVGLTDVNTIADALTSVLNAYGLSGEHATEVSDLMTQAIVQGKAEWKDLAASIGPAAVQAATAQVSFKEVAASIAEMTQIGMTAQRSSKNLAFEIRALEAPNKVAQKTFASLGITVNANTLAHDGLYNTIKRIDTALGGHKDVIVKNAKGQIDLEATTAATAKANAKWAEGMKNATGGAAGFLVAQIQLLDGGKKYTDILKSMDKATGLTTAAFEKMKDADPGFLFDLLKNKVQVAAITFGNSIMPMLIKFLGFLVDAVPAALSAIGDVWTNVLAKPVGAMLDAFGELAKAFLGMFSDGTNQKADVFGTVLGGIGSVVAQIATDLKVVAQVLTAAFGNPVVQAITKVLLVMKAVSLAMGLIRGVGGSLSRSFMGMASGLTGGFIKAPGAAGAVAPLDGSAAKLDQSAIALQEAAVALKGGALAQKEAAVSEGEMAATGLAARRAQLGEDLALGRSPNAALFGPGGFVKNVANDAKNALTSGISKVKGAIGGALGFVSKAFFPLMIADLGIEFLKAPIGDFLAKSTPWKRAANEMKDDFFGGLVDMVKAWQIGSDLFVALPQIQFGAKTAVKTENLGNFNLSQAEIDALGQGGLGGSLAQQRIEPRAIDALKQKAGESVQDWYARIKDTLDQNGLDTGTVLNALKGTTQGRGRGATRVVSPGALAAAQSQLAALVGQLGTRALADVQQAINDGVDQGLEGLGFTPGQTQFLTDAQKQKLALLIATNTNGQYDALVQWQAQQMLKAQQAPTRNITAKDVLKAQQGSGTPDESLHLRNAGTLAAAANIAFKESLAQNLQPAKDAYGKWYASVVSDPSGGKQATMAAGQAFISQWGAQIAAAKTDAAKTALAKKMGMTWDEAQAVLAASKLATGAALETAMSKAYRDTILAAAKDGSKDAAPLAAQIFFDQNSVAIGNAKTTKAKQKLLDAYNAMFPKGSEAKIGNIKGFTDAFTAWQGAGMMDPTKPDAMKLAMTGLPDLATTTKSAMDLLRDAAEAARIKLVSVAGALNGIAGKPLNSSGSPDDRNGGTSTSSSSSSTKVPHGAKLGFGGYAKAGASIWAGEFGPELIPRMDASGNVLSTNKVAALLMSVAKTAAGASAGAGMRSLQQRLDVENMYLTSPAEKGAILEELAFLAPAGV